MKILAAGDLHGISDVAEKLAKRAEQEQVDLVVLCGDLTHFDQPAENLIGPFKKRNQKVLFVPGNHDSPATADFFVQAYQVNNIHGYAAQYGKVGIFGAGGSTSVGPAFTIPEDEVFRLLKQGHDHLKDVQTKVMVTHEHPHGSKLGLGMFPGSTSVKKALEEFRPDVLICGHIHETHGVEEMIGDTRVINVGRKGKILDFS